MPDHLSEEDIERLALGRLNLAARVAVDMLVHGQPEFLNDYIVWHERDEDGKFSLATTHHAIVHRSGCHFCNPPCTGTYS